MKWFAWVLPAVFTAVLPAASYGQDFQIRVIGGNLLWPVNKSEKPRREDWWLVQPRGEVRGAVRVTVTFHAPFCDKPAGTEPCENYAWSQKVDVHAARKGGGKLSPPYYLLKGPGVWKAVRRAEMKGNSEPLKDRSEMTASIGDSTYVFARKLSDDEKRVAVTVRSGSVVQEVYACQTGGKAYPFCGDEGFEEILWAGDLDGDNRLDFIAQFTPKYSMRHHYLFTSAGAAAGGHVRLAAKTTRAVD